jgi:hypothetical protein
MSVLADLRTLVQSRLPVETRNRIRRRLFPNEDVDRFFERAPEVEDQKKDCEYAMLFWSHEGNPVQKWYHYLQTYDTYLRKFKGTSVRVLELGVSLGGSLELLRKFLGPEAVIYGVDINPDCARYDGIAGQVRIGSQADADFLRSIVEEMGGVDVVIDDGSHVSPHMRTSLDVLYPMLSDGGVYIVEDTHACYWRSYLGGYRSQRSFLETAKTLIDDIHHWYHGRGQRIEALSGRLKAMHVYDSMIVLEKAEVGEPRHSRIGGGAEAMAAK